MPFTPMKPFTLTSAVRFFQTSTFMSSAMKRRVSRCTSTIEPSLRLAGSSWKSTLYRIITSPRDKPLVSGRQYRSWIKETHYDRNIDILFLVVTTANVGIIIVSEDVKKGINV